MIYIPFFIVILIDKRGVREAERGEKRERTIRTHNDIHNDIHNDTKNDTKNARGKRERGKRGKRLKYPENQPPASGTQRGKRGKHPQPYRQHTPHS